MQRHVGTSSSRTWKFNPVLVLHAQVKSLYRHGHMSECSDKLEDFKFCMSLKSLHPEQKKDAWIQRQAERQAARRLDKSSENVWEIRKSVLRSPELHIPYLELRLIKWATGIPYRAGLPLSKATLRRKMELLPEEYDSPLVLVTSVTCPT